MVTKPSEGVESPQVQLSGAELAYLVKRVAQYGADKVKNNNISLLTETGNLDLLIGQMVFGLTPPPEAIARAIRAEMKNRALHERDRFYSNITDIIKTAQKEPEIPDYTNLLRDRGPWDKRGIRKPEWMGVDDDGRRIPHVNDLGLERKLPGFGNETLLPWPPGGSVSPHIPGPGEIGYIDTAGMIDKASYLIDSSGMGGKEELKIINMTDLTKGKK